MLKDKHYFFILLLFMTFVKDNKDSESDFFKHWHNIVQTKNKVNELLNDFLTIKHEEVKKVIEEHIIFFIQKCIQREN